MAVGGLFANAQQTSAVQAGQVIFREHDEGAHMFGVVSGEVHLYRGENRISTVGPGGVFGEMAIIDRSQRSLTAVAAADTVLAVIDRKMFLFLVHETPTFALDVMGAMAHRLRAVDATL